MLIFLVSIFATISKKILKITGHLSAGPLSLPCPAPPPQGRKVVLPKERTIPSPPQAALHVPTYLSETPPY